VKNKYSSEFKKRFLAVLSSEENKDINALFFSGGVDSTTILFALLELGRKPDLISFKQDGIESEDAHIGREIAEEYGLKYNIVEIPSDKKGILEDVAKVIPQLEYPLKTHVQCSIPFMHMCPELVKMGHTKAFTGLAAGDIYGLDKRTSMRYAEHGEDFIKELRWNTMMNDPKISYYDINTVSENSGIKLVNPYVDETINRWMIWDLSYKELHQGKPKSIAVDAFNKYWKLDEKKWYRKEDSLQVVSGIRERHDEVLLNDEEVNKIGAKGIVKLYNDMKKNLALSETQVDFDEF
jgi:asparagine synthetase B (glutamine-hydrolysing)